MAAKKSRRWLYIGGGIVLVLIVSAIVGARSGAFSSKKTGVAVELGQVRLKTLTQMVSASGKISPEVEIKISSDVSGEIVELRVKEGDPIRKGELLCRIRPDIIQAQLDQLRAALNAEKARREQIKANIRRAEANLKQQEDLFNKKLVSELAYVTAQSELDGLKASLKASDFSVESSEASVGQREKELERTTILAPIDGTVSKLNVELGERVVGSIQMAGTEIMRVARLEQMEVQVDVNENDIVNVQVGDSARVKVDAYTSRTIGGIVTQIANSASVSGIGTTEQVTNYKIKIRITTAHNELFAMNAVPARKAILSEKEAMLPDLVLKPGMSASVDILTETVENALSIPIQAVTVRDFAAPPKPKPGERAKAKKEAEEKEAQPKDVAAADTSKVVADELLIKKEDLRKVVFVVRNDTAYRREVVTGISDDTHIQILSGLEQGEQIVIGSYRVLSKELEDAAHVRKEDKNARAKRPSN
jgi:HlyD family secretion protein